MIRLLFPNVNIILIQSIDAVQNQLNGFKYANSLKVNKELLDSLLIEINIRTAWDAICIAKPWNSEKSLCKLAGIYGAAFKKKDYSIGSLGEALEHTRFGSCKSFCIAKDFCFWSPSE